MPEQLTKHPDVTLQVLRSAGARCGEGEAQQILTACPAERFCTLPGGEMCIYGLADASRMTQISPSDWQATFRSLSLEPATPEPAPPASEGSLLLGGGLLLAGVAIGVVFARWRGRR
ncbi:MAG: hypothetical protein H0W40_11590 [Methylibium sp.]|uniref:hypothetical protein n=1 Tax=Methylibium sp. TaxID=2067992 RepID=UPI00183E557D|nr:hypothetical protein [Methylibium sp.]MBA3598000.1 hypothetical protein [Methylibium sp.]